MDLIRYDGVIGLTGLTNQLSVMFTHFIHVGKHLFTKLEARNGQIEKRYLADTRVNNCN